MPRRPTTSRTYAEIIETKQAAIAKMVAVGALREATDLSMTLEDFVVGVSGAAGIKDVVAEVMLGDVFTEVRSAGEPTGSPTPKARVGRPPGSKTRRKKAKTAAKTKTGRPKKTKRKQSRADSATVTKRIDAIAAAIKENGGRMKTAEILAAVAAKKALFAGVSSNLVSQYLAKLLDEKPKRIERQGKKGQTCYRVAGSPAKKARKSKAAKRRAKRDEAAGATPVTGKDAES